MNLITHRPTNIKNQIHMIKNICKKILFSWWGWSYHVTEPTPEKCIICIAPHTSNWDFLIGKLYYTAMGRTSNFLMKKEWFKDH